MAITPDSLRLPRLVFRHGTAVRNARSALLLVGSTSARQENRRDGRSVGATSRCSQFHPSFGQFFRIRLERAGAVGSTGHDQFAFLEFPPKAKRAGIQGQRRVRRRARFQGTISPRRPGSLPHTRCHEAEYQRSFPQPVRVGGREAKKPRMPFANQAISTQEIAGLYM